MKISVISMRCKFRTHLMKKNVFLNVFSFSVTLFVTNKKKKEKTFSFYRAKKIIIAKIVIKDSLLTVSSASFFYIFCYSWFMNVICNYANMSFICKCFAFAYSFCLVFCLFVCFYYFVFIFIYMFVVDLKSFHKSTIALYHSLIIYVFFFFFLFYLSFFHSLIFI